MTNERKKLKWMNSRGTISLRRTKISKDKRQLIKKKISKIKFSENYPNELRCVIEELKRFAEEEKNRIINNNFTADKEIDGKANAEYYDFINELNRQIDSALNKYFDYTLQLSK